MTLRHAATLALVGFFALIVMTGCLLPWDFTYYPDPSAYTAGHKSGTGEARIRPSATDSCSILSVENQAGAPSVKTPLCLGTDWIPRDEGIVLGSRFALTWMRK